MMKAGSKQTIWTMRDMNILRELYDKEVPLKMIAEALNRNVKAVSRKARRMGLRYGTGGFEVSPSIIDNNDNDAVLQMSDGEIFDAWVATIYESTPDDYHPITPCDYCSATLDETFWGRGRHCFCSADCAIASVSMMESCNIVDGVCPTCLG